jgi:hypothetical protein
VSYLPLEGAAAVNGSLYSLTYSTAVGDGSQYTITADASRLLVSSSNTQFSGNVNIIGSVSASLFTGSFAGDSLNIDNDVKIENGFTILTSVSQSLNFADDVAAAAGGIPLGGLYRNGNFVAIRIT